MREYFWYILILICIPLSKLDKKISIDNNPIFYSVIVSCYLFIITSSVLTSIYFLIVCLIFRG